MLLREQRDAWMGNFMANGSNRLTVGAWVAGASLVFLVGCGSSSHGFPPTGGAGGAATGGSGGTGGTACLACAGAPGGGTSTGGTVGAECTAMSDCAGRSDGKLACDVASGTCVACVTSNNCAAGEDCVNNACVSGTSCNNSLDCPSAQVCDTIAKRCVECVSPADCPAGSQCVGDVCRSDCNSDKDCTPLGQLCNIGLGYCVDCVSQTDCAAAQYCAQGACTPDVCAANSSSCDANSVVTCNGDGSGTLPAVTCASSQTCVRSGSTASCVNQLCSPDVRGCAQGTEQIVLCSSDGLHQEITGDCATTGQVCVAAACKPVVCVAASTYCSGQEVRKCSAKGDSYITLATCASNQFCNGPAGRCDAQLCTPNQPACKSDIATTCNTDGSGYVAGGVDCASSAQHCVGGVCKDQVCAPSTRFCEPGVIKLCSADGTTSSVYQTCTTAQYCDAATVTCKAQICTPNAPTCNANTATTCNSDGSGYVTGGTACGTQYCVSGVCQNAIFADNFEDGDYVGWTTGTGTYTRTVTAPGANGTGYALSMIGTTYGSDDGLYRTFANVKPTNISWWAKPTASLSENAEFVLRSGASYSYIIDWFYFSTSSLMTYNAYSTPYQLGSWVHIEMRNINWTAKTYDWYVNGAFIRTNTFVSTTATDITRLDLFSYYPTTAYWDEIVFN